MVALSADQGRLKRVLAHLAPTDSATFLSHFTVHEENFLAQCLIVVHTCHLLTYILVLDILNRFFLNDLLFLIDWYLTIRAQASALLRVFLGGKVVGVVSWRSARPKLGDTQGEALQPAHLGSFTRCDLTFNPIFGSFFVLNIRLGLSGS